jgi:lipopolysaccharide export system protein LptC
VVSIPEPGRVLHRRVPAGRRREDAWIEAGGRHSRRVAVLKRLLPAAGIGLLLLIAVWPRLAPMWERVRATIPVINLRDARELDMIHPRYAGVDRNGHPFVVTAVSGRQLAGRQDLMSLRAPRADITTHSGANIVVTANSGIYQSQARVLDMFGNVTLVHQNGTKFVTQSARIEAAGNRAEGTQPVVGHGPSGDLTAQGFRILDKGDTIFFTGRSDLVLKSTKPVAPKQPPAALPPRVAAVARQTEAEAKPLLAAARARTTAERRVRHRAAVTRRRAASHRRRASGRVSHHRRAQRGRG